MTDESSERPQPFSLTNETDGGVCVAALGGLGEVGANCTIYEHDGQIMVVDCGVNFPEEREYGVDLVIPSFNYLTAHADRVAGIVLTHAHEDHLGAVPYLLRDLNPPIYASPLALELLRRKLREHGLFEHASLHEVTAGDVIEVGPFQVEFIHVNHSVPQATSLAITTPVGVIVHSSDFKVDHQPREEDPIDLARFAALGEEGVLLLLSDSTNIEVSGYTRSEAAVAQALAKVVEDAPGRVVVTLFASNLHRVQSLLDIAHRHGRRVLLLGRSLVTNVDIGLALGLIHLADESIIIQPNDLDAYRHNELLILTTGSQGEPRSALTRIAMDDHPYFKALPGDRVVFSSRMIPGNEKAIHRIINHLYRRGATVVLDPPHAVHASGHACREEQKLLINLVQPDYFVPIHGEYRHLAEHASLAEELGVGDVILLETGDVLTLWDDDFELTGRIPSGHVLVDGKGTDDAPSVALQDRRKLARSGIVVAWLVLDVNSGEVISGPELMVQGVVGLEDRDALIAEASRYALAEVSKLNRESRREPAEVGETLRLAVRRIFNRRIERKPVVVPIVHEL